MKEPIVVKLGGSAITKKDQKYTMASDAKLQRIFRELRNAPNPLVVISGGGSYGHPAVVERGLETEVAAAYVRLKMQTLRERLMEYFLEYELPVHAFSPYSIGMEKRDGRFVGPLKRKVERTLNQGELPFTSGDVVNEVNNSYVVLSGDDQSIYLANELDAKRLIMVLDDNSEGVHPEYPIEEYPPISSLTKEQWIRVKERHHAHGGAGMNVVDVTGGIFEKVELLFRTDPSTEVLIIGSKRAGTLHKALTLGVDAIKKEGMNGTYIPSRERTQKSVGIVESTTPS